jgi:hypothetical protein
LIPKFNNLCKSLKIWPELIDFGGFVAFPVVDELVTMLFGELDKIVKTRQTAGNASYGDILSIEPLFETSISRLISNVDTQPSTIKETILLSASSSVYNLVKPERFQLLNSQSLKVLQHQSIRKALLTRLKTTILDFLQRMLQLTRVSPEIIPALVNYTFVPTLRSEAVKCLNSIRVADEVTAVSEKV